MRRNLTSLMAAISSAMLLLVAGHAHAQRTYVLRSAAVTVTTDTTGTAQVLCNGSDLATGGGLVSAPSSVSPEKMHVSDSFPISDATGEPTLDNADPRGWRVIMFNPVPDVLDFQAFVVCTSASRLTVSVAGTGGGTVSSSDGSIRCPGTCAATFNGGTTVTLTASPGSGSIFGGWSGCDTVAAMTCTVTMSAARSVTANFDVQRFTLTVNTAGAGSGTVSSSDGLISSCSGTCTATYDGGATVTLTATPASGSSFGGWSGCDTVADTTCTVTMSAARSVTAAFNVP